MIPHLNITHLNTRSAPAHRLRTSKLLTSSNETDIGAGLQESIGFRYLAYIYFRGKVRLWFSNDVREVPLSAFL